MGAADLRELLCRARESLDAAVTSVRRDPEAALDDVLAARLLVTTALLSLPPGSEPLRS